MSMWYLDLPKGEQYFNWNEPFYHVLLGEQDKNIALILQSCLVWFNCVVLAEFNIWSPLGISCPEFNFRLICDGFSGSCLRRAKPSYYAESVQQYSSQSALQYFTQWPHNSPEITTRTVWDLFLSKVYDHMLFRSFSVGSQN